MNLSLSEHPHGISTEAGARVVYDLERDEAHLGSSEVTGPALLWELNADDAAALTAAVELDPAIGWVIRCDRVDFPPGGVAHWHTHPGPGIRRLLFGELTIETARFTWTYGAGGAWFEDAGEAVLATASTTAATAFVRVLLLPREWQGKRTIHYLKSEQKPTLQRATVLLEEPLEL